MKMYHLSAKQIIMIVAVVVFMGFVVLHFIGIRFTLKHPSGADINPQAEAIMLARGDVLLNKADQALAAAEAAMSADVPDTAPAVMLQAGKKLEEAWVSADVKSPVPTLPLNEKIVSYEAVQLNPHPATFPSEGEQIVMPMLKGKKVVVEVQSVSINPNGDYTWSGHVQGAGNDYPVVMTYGEHSTFASITTPEGSFTMESVEGVGWLYKNPSMTDMATPGTTDFRDPPIDH